MLKLASNLFPEVVSVASTCSSHMPNITVTFISYVISGLGIFTESVPRCMHPVWSVYTGLDTEE